MLLFHSEEDWAPTTVESYLATARVERQAVKNVWTKVPPPIPTSTVGCTLTPCFRLNLPCVLRSGYACYQQQAAKTTKWDRPVVYGTVASVPASAPPPPGFTQRPRYLLHYWLFYAFDDWHSAHKRLWQTHEGDWESITVGIGSDGVPQFAAYSEHCSGSVRPWKSVTLRGGTHPVAYVALGSHANWFTSAAANTNFGECIKGGPHGSGRDEGSAARQARAGEDRRPDGHGASDGACGRARHHSATADRAGACDDVVGEVPGPLGRGPDPLARLEAALAHDGDAGLRPGNAALECDDRVCVVAPGHRLSGTCMRHTCDSARRPQPRRAERAL